MEKRVKAAFLSGMVLFLLVSCGDVFMSNYGKDGGNLVIRFPGAAGDASAGRAAIPASATLAQLEYRVTLTSGSQTLSVAVPAGETSAVLSVTPGVWDIKAEAYLPPGTYGNDLPLPVGTGSAQVSVAAGESAGVSIKMIFDNTVPASVEVVYMGTSYTADLEGNVYKVLLFDYDLTQSVAITVNPALPDQDISAVTNNNQYPSSYVGARGDNTAGSNTSPTFTVSANAGEGFSTAYTVELEFGWNVNTSASPMDLKNRFGITTSGTPGVTEAFNAVHWLINTPEAGDFADIIQLGDYIELPAGTFSVLAYNSDGAISGLGVSMPLMVVGINSFNGKNGNNTPHVVFQFRNVPGTRRMNSTADNTWGYAGSEMRTYLTPTGLAGTGTFYAGLTGAGVPDTVVWAPSRRVANGGSAASGADIIADKLWLPTEFEIGNGVQSYSSTAWETPANQAYLEYYTNDNLRIKNNTNNAAAEYWRASPVSASTDKFCITGTDGIPNNAPANSAYGVAPAFCVK